MKRAEILARLNEILQIKKKIQKTVTPLISTGDMLYHEFTFKRGVSVVIPTYKGEDVILNCLNSLYRQTYEKSLFDVIIVINGEKDSTESIVSDFKNKTGMNNIILLYSTKASASSARNLGLEYALREYTLFLDDDDFLSDNYLEEMSRYATNDSVVVSQIVNVDENGQNDPCNSINQQIINAENKIGNDYTSLNMVATINACKLIPTKCLKNIKYYPALKSGEDIVFFVELFVKNDLKFNVVPIEKQVIYYRVLRSNSVSRQFMTFDFYVKQRLDVITKLDNMIGETSDLKKQTFIKQKINAQTTFINRYLNVNTNEREIVTEEIKKRNLSYFPFAVMNKGLASKLIISYCFPPYVDTSGNVMAKRLRYMNTTVDVVYNKMDKVRPKDLELNNLVSDLVDERIEIPSYPSFSNWKAIEDFCKLGINKINNTKNYKEVYSRAMWPGSHFLAYQYKLLNPRVRWVAEFSDPLLFDIHGKKREAHIEDQSFIKRANKLIRKKNKLPYVSDSNLFFWCEYLPYVFADELIFTNENQLKYMVDNFPVKEVRTIIKEKAVISPHPTMSIDYYNIKKSEYALDPLKINVAYFGNFYKTRNLEDLFKALEALNEQERNCINLHIFTANPSALKEEIKESKLGKHIFVNPYVNYNEFLNLTTKFDCLVVNDAHTKPYKAINPYLPSKLSDYLGSGTKVWGLYEENSVLSKYPLNYKSELGNVKEATGVFQQIVSDKLAHS
ncbi:glycosyltransferase [Cytobacillus oceanisediminis]|uniref:glycosyltransferase n=1 Tax=Cytobacillus oceanisediminis TaxID=665099 RepID=UPI001C246DD8|nr:glycosyltransferase [Cytobacillus oceanisediminis]MBU8731721.1 glycosyltransferase [Cytobacillus oceanisediminis]